LTTNGKVGVNSPVWSGNGGRHMGNSMKSAQYLIEGSLADAARGDPAAYFDLGIAFSTGSGGVDVDLVQAHKWFNLAALGGNREGQQCRADVSAEMSRDEIAEAQRQARAWLDETARRPSHQRYAA
jgi:uncharacterized protein